MASLLSMTKFSLLTYKLKMPLTRLNKWSGMRKNGSLRLQIYRLSQTLLEICDYLMAIEIHAEYSYEEEVEVEDPQSESESGEISDGGEGVMDVNLNAQV